MSIRTFICAGARWRRPAGERHGRGLDFRPGKIVSGVKQLKTAVIGPDQQEEHELGRIAAATLLRRGQADEPPRAAGLCSARWGVVALQSERPDLPWRFAVLDDNSINAFAAPGGYVFDHPGLARQAAQRSRAGRCAGARNFPRGAEAPSKGPAP